MNNTDPGTQCTDPNPSPTNAHTSHIQWTAMLVSTQEHRDTVHDRRSPVQVPEYAGASPLSNSLVQ